MAEFASYHPVGRRSVIAWRIRVGSIRSPDLQFEPSRIQFVPTEERFYGGGPTSVRGFRQNELGPLIHVDEITTVAAIGVDTLNLTSPTGGNQLVLGNLEYRFPLSRTGRLGGVLFVDAGRVVNRGSPQEDPGIRVTPGMGLRFFTPLGPVRLDLAYNPYGPEEGELFARRCGVTPTGRSCGEAVLVDDRFVRERDGLFGLGEHIPFLKDLRVNFSIGQAF